MKNSPEKQLETVYSLSRKLYSKLEIRDFSAVKKVLAALFTTLSQYQQLAKKEYNEEIAYSTSPLLEEISHALNNSSDNKVLESYVKDIIGQIKEFKKVPSSEEAKILEIATLWQNIETLISFTNISSVTGKVSLDYNSFLTYYYKHKKNYFDECNAEKTTELYFCSLESSLAHLKEKSTIRLGKKELQKNPIANYIEAEFEKLENKLYKTNSFNKKIKELSKILTKNSKSLKNQYPLSFNMIEEILRNHDSSEKILEKEIPSLLLIAIVYSKERSKIKNIAA